MKTPGIGIKGLGILLPPEKRTNSFWSPEVVASFKGRPGEDLGKLIPSGPRDESPEGKLKEIMKEEMGKFKDDPFHGAIERRVAAEGTLASEMETAAAKAALEDAHLMPGDIDLLLVQSFVPDQPVPPNPSRIHQRLELSQNCPAIATDPTCSGFLFQLMLASSYLQTSGGRNALLVQSTMFSKVLDYTMPVSTTFGDAASAVVIGRTSKPERGVLAVQSFVDSRYNQIAIVDSPGPKPWYAGCGPIRVGAGDLGKLKDVPLLSAIAARDSVKTVLDESGLDHKDVNFFTSHQPTSSFVTICKRAAGLDHARSYDSFQSIGAVSGCVAPVNMFLARKEGILKDDDVAVLFTTGNGVSWNAAVLRWGA